MKLEIIHIQASEIKNIKNLILFLQKKKKLERYESQKKKVLIK